MKVKINLKKTLAALCVLALFAGLLPASVFAGETVVIPDSDYIYVNGENKIFKVDGDISALLRLIVEVPGRVHILSSGVDIKLVIYDEGTAQIKGVYSSEKGLMDVPFDANAGAYLLGFSGSGEVAVLVADEDVTEQIYAEASSAPAEGSAESSSDNTEEEKTEAEEEKTEATEQPAENGTEESSDTPEDLPLMGDGEREAVDEESPAAADAAPSTQTPESSFDPSVPIRCPGVLHEQISVLAVLKEAGAPIEAVTWVSGDMEGRVFSSGRLEGLLAGDWLLTPYAYFDSVEVRVTASDDTVYTLIITNPDPAQAAGSAETAEAPEQPAENTTEPAADVSVTDNTEETEETEEPEQTEEPAILSNPDPDAEQTPAADDALPAGREVAISMERLEGNRIRLFVENTEEESGNPVYQWQYSLDNELWLDAPGATEREYIFTLGEALSNSYWRLIVTEQASPDVSEGTAREATETEPETEG